jgi:hypothetical protein
VNRPIARKLRVAVFHSYSHHLIYAYIYYMKGETSIGQSRAIGLTFRAEVLLGQCLSLLKTTFLSPVQFVVSRETLDKRIFVEIDAKRVDLEGPDYSKCRYFQHHHN